MLLLLPGGCSQPCLVSCSSVDSPCLHSADPLHAWQDCAPWHLGCDFARHVHIHRRDTDEFLILKQPGLTLPALLEQTVGGNPITAAAAFHRFAYRAGCLRRQNQSAGAGTGVSAGGGGQVVQEEAPWHAVYDARERYTESARSVSPCVFDPKPQTL